VRGGGRQTDGEAENVALPSHKEKDGSSLEEISQVLADLAFTQNYTGLKTFHRLKSFNTLL